MGKSRPVLRFEEGTRIVICEEHCQIIVYGKYPTTRSNKINYLFTSKNKDTFFSVKKIFLSFFHVRCLSLVCLENYRNAKINILSLN